MHVNLYIIYIKIKPHTELPTDISKFLLNNKNYKNFGPGIKLRERSRERHDES